MTIPTRKFHMKKGCMLLILLTVPIMFWICIKYINRRLQDEEWKQMVEAKRTQIEERIKKKIETLSNDIEESEIFPKDIRHVPPSIRRELKESLRQKYEDDKKYVKELRENSQGKKIEKGRRTKIETVSNDIEEKETYPIDIRYIPASIRRKHEEMLRELNKDDQKYLKELKEMLQGNELLRDIKFEDDFLRLFITSNDFKIDQAFSKIQNFLNFRIDHNYFFHNMSFDFTQNPAYRFVTILPHRRKDGTATILFELAKWDPDIVPLEHLKKIMFIIYLQALLNPVTQASGFNIIYDFENAGFRYIKYGTPENLYLLHHASFEAMPAKYVGFHLVNINVIGNILLTITRPFLPKFIESIFYTHSSVKELHNFFPASMLPVQYGGDLMDYYAADWIRKANQRHGNFPAGGQRNVF